jgi:hypothetical protein
MKATLTQSFFLSFFLLFSFSPSSSSGVCGKGGFSASSEQNKHYMEFRNKSGGGVFPGLEETSKM